MRLQKPQRLLLVRVLMHKVFHFAAHSGLARQREQPQRSPPGRGKDVVFFPIQRTAGECDGYGCSLVQQAPEHLLLLGGKVGETVQPQVLSRSPGTGFQLIRRPGQPVAGSSAVRAAMAS